MKRFLLPLLCLLFASLCLPASAQTAHHNDLKWSFTQTSTAGTAKSFNVKVSTVTGGPYTTLANVPVTQLSYSDTSASLTDGSTHFYVITAVAGDGVTESSPSNEIKCVTPFLAPPAPTGASGTPF